MKKLTLAVCVAMAVPLSANALDFTLNSAKNVVTQTSSTSCYVTDGKAASKFKQKLTIKPTTLGFANLGGVISIMNDTDTGPGEGTVNNIVYWSGDMLLNQQYGVTDGGGLPVITPVTLKGKVTAAKGSNVVITFDKDTAPTPPAVAYDNELILATALNHYHGAVFNDLFQNAALDPVGAKKAAPYVMKLNIKNGQMTETSFITSSDGPCTSSAKIVRKYRPL